MGSYTYSYEKLVRVSELAYTQNNISDSFRGNYGSVSDLIRRFENEPIDITDFFHQNLEVVRYNDTLYC